MTKQKPSCRQQSRCRRYARSIRSPGARVVRKMPPPKSFTWWIRPSCSTFIRHMAVLFEIGSVITLAQVAKIGSGFPFQRLQSSDLAPHPGCIRQMKLRIDFEDYRRRFLCAHRAYVLAKCSNSVFPDGQAGCLFVAAEGLQVMSCSFQQPGEIDARNASTEPYAKSASSDSTKTGLRCSSARRAAAIPRTPRCHPLCEKTRTVRRNSERGKPAISWRMRDCSTFRWRFNFSRRRTRRCTSAHLDLKCPADS